ncbi:glucose-6-phosphate dehydrogenase assembly protein OpcA [Actinomycetospora atypica]|uniref:Glucose-6-phosphate dehydrogenase assembly protein OpcA n=1 Tax=Actinomycetospora atypica TaxID=1290095 RepID=A0ABV9YRS5_9PSEU
MIVDLPSTDTSAVNRKMVELRESAGAVALGRVLTLVISTEDGPEAEQAIQAANDASREHPCRVLVLARGIRRAASRLDAQIRIGGDAGASEVIVLRMYGPLADQGGSIIVPLLLPDAPIVTWWPGEPPVSPSEDPVGSVAGRRITDVSTTKSPSRTLVRLGNHYRPGDTDIAWSRITSWRALLTAALDEPPYEDITRAEVDGVAESASADLLAGWLSSRLDVPVTRSTVEVPGGHVGAVRLIRPSGNVELRRLDSKTARLTQPGQPVRRVALSRRTARECLAEELRRLDRDEIFEEALAAIPRSGGGRRSSSRTKARA